MKVYLLSMKFHVSFVVTEKCSTHTFSKKIQQRAITLTLGSGVYGSLCSTLPLINVYLPIKFHADIFCSH